VQFADGTVWSRQQLIDKETTGTSGNDVLYGTGGADTFDGKGGNDVENGRGGNDTFIFNTGYGQLEINAWDWSGANGVLRFGSGISASTVAVTASSSGNDVVLTIGGNDEKRIGVMLVLRPAPKDRGR